MPEVETCKHIELITVLKEPKELICEECILTGNKWVHLRTCQTCGSTLCCDASPAKHMTEHYHRTSHPVVISAEPGEQWMYCYAHKLFVEYD